MDSSSKKKRRKSVSSVIECVMHRTNITIADKKNIIKFSEQSFSTFIKSLVLRNDKSYMILLRPLNRFPTGKLDINFSNKKEYCK